MRQAVVRVIHDWALERDVPVAESGCEAGDAGGMNRKQTSSSELIADCLKLQTLR